MDESEKLNRVVEARITIPHYPLSSNGASAGNMIQVREVGVGSRPPDPDFLVPHRKDYYLFVLVRKGSSRHWIDSVPYTLKPDTFYFTIPQQVHLKEDSQPMQGMIVAFTEEFLRMEEFNGLQQLPILQNPAGGHELRLTAADLRYVEDIMQKMYAEFSAAGPASHPASATRNAGGNGWNNQMLTSWLRVLLIYLSRLYTEQFSTEVMTQGYTLLRNFQALIGQHYHHLHDVAAYAGLLNLTPNYFSDLVKQQSGVTALAHIHNRLLVEARRRLLHTELSVKEIADQLGFEDAAYFNRFFKRLSGTTPVGYRERIREMYH